MTEGIIQEAFFDFLARNYYKSDKGLVVSVEQVTAFKKELIEKIKQEFETNDLYTIYIYNISPKYILKKLIGDNQQ